MSVDSLDAAYREFRELIVAHLLQKGWKRLLGKRIRYEQSLLEHSLNTLDVVLTYLPIFRQTWHPPLTPDEEVALIVTAVAHDAGKATDDFQRYIRGETGWVGHWSPELTQELVGELYRLWAQCSGQDVTADEHQVREALAGVRYTIRQERTAALEAGELLRTDHLSSRWRLFMDVVDDVDNLVSCPSVLDAARFLRRGQSPLARVVSVGYHQARVRGVSTVLLHRAAQDAFMRRGWQPLLFYPEGTLYISTQDGAQTPSPEEIAEELQAVAWAELETRSQMMPQLVVGRDIRQNFLPKPELFDADRLRDYLRVAATRARAKPADKVKAWNVIKVVDALHPAATKHIRRDGRLPSQPSAAEAVRLERSLPEAYSQEARQALGSSQPEMAIFKFFKHVLVKFQHPNGDPPRPHAHSVLSQQYEMVFGKGTFEKLMQMAKSSLKPAEDYLLAVRFFHELPGAVAGHPSIAKVGLLRPEERQRALIDLLAGIAEAGFAQLPERPSFSEFARKLAQVGVQDLLAPANLDVKALAERQIKAYSTTKAPRPQEAVCPICNAPLRLGSAESFTALADTFGQGVEKFSNRQVAHGPETKLTACAGCYYERVLQQLLLASRPEEVIAIFPQMNLSPHGAAVLVRRVRELEEQARRLSAPETAPPDRRFNLTATWSLAEKVGSTPVEDLTRDPRLMATAFSYELGEKTRRTYRQDLARALREEFEEDLEELNTFYQTAFASFEEAADAIIRKEPPMWAGLAAEKTAPLYERAFKLANDYAFVVQTANLVLIPIGHGFGGSTSSETKAGLARLLAALFLATALDVSVAIVPFSELADVIGERSPGVAYVPPVAQLRHRLGTAWVSLADRDRWLQAIAAAFRLARLAEYPERSDVYQALSEPSVGRIIRRIDEVGNGRMFNPAMIPQLEVLKEVLG
jgi:hypothetical protein